MGAKSKLTQEDRAFIIDRFNLRALTQKALATKYGVSTATIAKVIRDSKIQNHSVHENSKSNKNFVDILKTEIEKDEVRLTNLQQIKKDIENLEQIIQKKKQALQLLEETQFKGELKNGEE